MRSRSFGGGLWSRLLGRSGSGRSRNGRTDDPAVRLLAHGVKPLCPSDRRVVWLGGGGPSVRSCIGDKRLPRMISCLILHQFAIYGYYMYIVRIL